MKSAIIANRPGYARTLTISQPLMKYLLSGGPPPAITDHTEPAVIYPVYPAHVSSIKMALDWATIPTIKAVLCVYVRSVYAHSYILDVLGIEAETERILMAYLPVTERACFFSSYIAVRILKDSHFAKADDAIALFIKCTKLSVVRGKTTRTFAKDVKLGAGVVTTVSGKLSTIDCGVYAHIVEWLNGWDERIKELDILMGNVVIHTHDLV